PASGCYPESKTTAVTAELARRHRYRATRTPVYARSRAPVRRRLSPSPTPRPTGYAPPASRPAASPGSASHPTHAPRQTPCPARQDHVPSGAHATPSCCPPIGLRSPHTPAQSAETPLRRSAHAPAAAVLSLPYAADRTSTPAA